MAAVSLATLDARVRERCDQVNSGFVLSNANSLYALINEGAQKLHAILATQFGNDYIVSSSALTLVSGQASYALPADFFKLLGIDLKIGGADMDLKKFTFKERNAYKLAVNASYQTQLPRYRLSGGNLLLYPVPGIAYTGTIWYVPELQVAVHGGGTFANQLVNADDTVSFNNGWERLIVLYAAIAVLAKEESETTELRQEMKELVAEITAAAENRDAAAPQQAVDVEQADIDPRWIMSHY